MKTDWCSHRSVEGVREGGCNYGEDSIALLGLVLSPMKWNQCVGVLGGGGRGKECGDGAVYRCRRGPGYGGILK